jgi:hypothetical protein
MSTLNYNVLARYFSVPAQTKQDPTVLAARGRHAAAMKKVKALQAKYPQINVEKDQGDYWVTCDGVDPDDESDPLYDQHFCVGGEEVLEAVQVYVKYLDA